MYIARKELRLNCKTNLRRNSTFTTEIAINFNLRWPPTVSCKVEKCKFQPPKVLMDISEKNETKLMHTIIFRATNTVNGKAFAMTTVAFHNTRK